MKRFVRWSDPTVPLLAILSSLLARVDIATKPLWLRLQRAREARWTGCSVLDAFRVSGMVPIQGGVTLTEGPHTGEALAWEAHSARREQVVVLSGQNLKANTVCGRINKGVGRMSVPAVVGTGNGVMSAVSAGPLVERGNYVITCITAVANGGIFSVTSPSGQLLPNAVVGTPYDVDPDHLTFTIADGATDFIVGDTFTIVVGTTAPTVVGTGNGLISGLSLGPDALPGLYRVEVIAAITNGGTFKVVAPDGDEVATGSIVAGAGGTLVLAGQRQLNLTITDGATDFAVGDFFNVAVFNELGGGKVVVWDPLVNDGRDDVAGMLLGAIDAATVPADTPGVLIVRDSIVIKGALQWGAAITAEQKDTAYLGLIKLGVIPRDSVAW